MVSYLVGLLASGVSKTSLATRAPVDAVAVRVAVVWPESWRGRAELACHNGVHATEHGLWPRDTGNAREDAAGVPLHEQPPAGSALHCGIGRWCVTGPRCVVDSSLTWDVGWPTADADRADVIASLAKTWTTSPIATEGFITTMSSLDTDDAPTHIRYDCGCVICWCFFHAHMSPTHCNVLDSLPLPCVACLCVCLQLLCSR